MDHSKNEEEERGIAGYNKKDVTHKLSCRHAFNVKSGFDYTMNCIILKRMPKYRLKILVFGDRYWNYNTDKKHIRYIDESRVKPIHGGS